jgi:hypothetical protein
MTLEFESLAENATHLPENYLPTALPLLLADASLAGFYPLIPANTAEPLSKTETETETAQISAVSGEILASPECLEDFLAGTYPQIKRYIGPPMRSANNRELGKINSQNLIVPNYVDVTIIIDAGFAFWNPQFAVAANKNCFEDIGFLAFDSGDIMGPTVQFLGAQEINTLTKMNRAQGHDTEVIAALGTRFPESVFGVHPDAGRLYTADGFNHGTAMADLVSGGHTNTPPKLFAIELPATVLLDANGETLQAVLSLAIHEALVRVFNWAARDDKLFTPQIKIVLPYAFLGGPHDGKHPVVQNIDQYANALNSSKISLQFFIPKGNHQQDQLYAELGKICAQSKSAKLQWFIQPDDYASNTVEITFKGEPCQALHVTAPDGRKASTHLGDGVLSVLTIDGTQKIGAVWSRSINDGQTRVRLSLGAPVLPNQTGPRPPTGNWSIQLESLAGEMKNIQLWVLREDGTRLTRRSYPSRQSYFNDPVYQRKAASGGFSKVDVAGSKIRRKGTVSVLATSTNTNVKNAGAQEKLAGNPETAWYSGRRKNHQSSDVDVLVDDGWSSRGYAALVNGSARKKRVSGTSVSVAVAARKS